MSIDGYAGGSGRGAASLKHRNRDATFPAGPAATLSTLGYAPRIVVTTVYHPSDGNGAGPGGGLPPWPDGPRLVRSLSEALSRHMHARFLGHGASPSIRGPHPWPDNRQPWFCGVIEPNAWVRTRSGVRGGRRSTGRDGSQSMNPFAYRRIVLPSDETRWCFPWTHSGRRRSNQSKPEEWAASGWASTMLPAV